MDLPEAPAIEVPAEVPRGCFWEADGRWRLSLMGPRRDFEALITGSLAEIPGGPHAPAEPWDTITLALALPPVAAPPVSSAPRLRSCVLFPPGLRLDLDDAIEHSVLELPAAPTPAR